MINSMKSIYLVNKFVHDILPKVDKEIYYWENFVRLSISGELKIQALASLKDKKFHCQGGSFYSMLPDVDINNFVKFIVAFQTISDYLDNLCDRVEVNDEQAFRQLHLAITDALDPTQKCKDYYLYYPYTKDGGYLKKLVTTCQYQIQRFPSYNLIKYDILTLGSLYSNLQTYKHLTPTLREEKLLNWLKIANRYTNVISHWEFAAATGSTLGIFMLCALANNSQITPSNIKLHKEAYFPWITGLHILLDYFIDYTEDLEHNDLNFLTYYTGTEEKLSRLILFKNEALAKTANTTDFIFNETIVKGLLALYLSDPKIKRPEDIAIKNKLLQSSGTYTKLLYKLSQIMRFFKIV